MVGQADADALLQGPHRGRSDVRGAAPNRRHDVGPEELRVVVATVEPDTVDKVRLKTLLNSARIDRVVPSPKRKIRPTLINSDGRR